MSTAEITVAILRIHADALAELCDSKLDDEFSAGASKFFGPADFDLLMAVPPPPLFAAGPSCSSQVQIEHQALSLPQCRPTNGERPEEAAIHFFAQLDPSLRQLATNNNIRPINIPLANLDNTQLPGCSSTIQNQHFQFSPQLIFIPLIHSQCQSTFSNQEFEFCPFANVLHAAMNYDCSLVDANSQNHLLRLGEWLNQGQCRLGPPFLHSLFLAPPSAKRILCCVHNPAYDQRMFGQCYRTLGNDKENLLLMRQRSSELEDAVKLNNAIRAEMLRREKYDAYVINPLFGTDIPSRRRAMAPDYFVKCREFGGGQEYHIKRRRRRSTMGASSGNGNVQHQRAPTEFWAQQYPLHKYAFDGNAQGIKELLAQGLDPNELDNDFWTPLHYCAFYNRLEACQILLLSPKTDVNVANRTGATPMHFAALNGHVYVAELLLSHQFANINIRDSNGKTPLDLCAPVAKPDWQGVAFLLQQSAQIRLTKMEVQLVGGECLQMEVENLETATAGEIRAKIMEMEGLEPTMGERIFAIWLVDSKLSLQLKAEQTVQVHLDKWKEHLEKFAGEKFDENNRKEEEDRVRIALKRDARTLLSDEQMVARKSPVAISLLYGEAVAQFLDGMFPCHEKHYLPMAAVIAHCLYGSEWPQKSVDVQFLSRILPAHLISSPTTDLRSFASIVSKIRQAHRQLVGLNLVQLQLRFLTICWSLNVYGCTFFRAFMLMAKPLRGNLEVHIGLNDWGICVLNANTHRQIAAIEMDKLSVKYTPNTHFMEVQNRKRDFVATITTPQAQLINNLLKQLKLKVQSVKNCVMTTAV